MIYGNDPERPGEEMPHREQLDKIGLDKPLPKMGGERISQGTLPSFGDLQMFLLT